MSTRLNFLKATTGIFGTLSLTGCIGDDNQTISYTTSRANGTLPSNTTAGNRRTAGARTSGAQHKNIGSPNPDTHPRAYQRLGSISQLEQEFDRVIDITAVGADPTGQDDVAPVIQSEIASNTALYFPRGTYKMQRPARLIRHA